MTTTRDLSGLYNLDEVNATRVAMGKQPLTVACAEALANKYYDTLTDESKKTALDFGYIIMCGEEIVASGLFEHAFEYDTDIDKYAGMKRMKPAYV